MYAALPDPYCYTGTSVLKNVQGIREQKALDRFETAAIAQRARENFPDGPLDARHYCVVYRHLFQDVYRWAGTYRTVRIAKGDSMFCYPEHIASEMEHLFAWLESRNFLADLTARRFAADAAHFLATLNAIHPFREGNGRTQLSFLAILAVRAGHPLILMRLDPEVFLAAMIESFQGDEKPLARQMGDLIDL